MKKLSILFLSVLALGMTLTSCSKSDSSSTAQASIVGKWQFSTMDGTFGTQAIPAGTPENRWSDSSCTSQGMAYWQFENGTALHYGLYDSTKSCALTSIDVTYSVDSKNTTLTVNTPNGTAQYPIVKLTATELVWTEQGTATDADGNSINAVINHHMIKK